MLPTISNTFVLFYMTLDQVMIVSVCRRKQGRRYCSPLRDRSEGFLLSHSLSTAGSVWTRRFRPVRRTIRHRERERFGRSFGINRFIFQKCSRLNHFRSRNKISFWQWCVCIYIQAKIHVLRKKPVVNYLLKKSHIYLNIILLIKFDFYFKSKFCPMHHDTYWIL